MRARPFLLLLLAALLVFLGRAVWWSDEEESEHGFQEPAAGQLERQGDAKQQGAAELDVSGGLGLRRRDDLTNHQSTDSRFGVVGQVRWREGGPVADRSVILVEEDSGATVAETRSDANGNYALFLPQGEHSNHPPRDSLDLHCPGFALANPLDAFATPADPPPTADLILVPGRALSIHTRDHRSSAPAPFISVVATCDIDYEHELFTFTDARGNGELHLPHEGPWDFIAYTRQLEGYEVGFPSTPWLEEEIDRVVVDVVTPPSEMHLQAVDARTGVAVEHASYRVAKAPEDARYLPNAGLAEMPDPLPFADGRLRVEFTAPGRAFVKIEAEGYLSEVVEWVEDDARLYEVGLIPLLDAPIEVTRQGEPVATDVTIAFNRHSLLLHDDEHLPFLEASPQVGTLHTYRTDTSGRCNLQLPDQEARNAPVFFDLWIQDGSTRRFLGSLADSNLGPAPWRFELEPPTGTLILDVVDAQGEGVPAVPYQITTTLAPSIRDSADRARSGRRSQILTTDLEGRIEVDLPAPSHVVAIGSGTLSAESVHAEGDLREGETLQLQAVIDPQERAMQPHPITRGHIVVDGGADYARDQRLLKVRATPIDERALAAVLPSWLTRVEADREGSFQLQLPEGRYALTLDAETYAVALANGRSVECEAGDQDVELSVPPPAGLRIHTTDLGTGLPLAVDDAWLTIAGERLAEMEVWEAGVAANLSLFAPRVEYVLEGDGFVPLIGSVDLTPGRTTELYLGMDHGRPIDFRLVASGDKLVALPQMRVVWKDPPGGTSPYEIPLSLYTWEAAPITGIRVEAFFGEVSLGEFQVPQGMGRELLRIPLPKDLTQLLPQ